MCSKRKTNFLYTVTFRLTLWYAIMFGILSLAVFLIVYVVLTSSLAQKTDEDLLATAKEFDALYRTRGVKALRAEFQREAGSRGINRVFFRLLSPQFDVIATSEINQWGALSSIHFHPWTPSHDRINFDTVSIPGHRHRVRTVLHQTDDGNIIQIGTTLKDNEILMEKYRETFGAALAVMLLCGGLAGWLMARRAMSGVERVTQTAIHIGEGDLSRRVPMGKEGREIDDLALAFNEMLDRIRALVKELKEVTNNIAHDLRSPITRIRGIAETALSAEQGIDAYREMAGVVIEESDHLVEMIRTMLEIAQAESGVAELEITKLDINGVIKDATELFLSVAEDREIRLEVDPSMEPLIVLGDVTRLQRVIANLLDNAIKFTPSGGKVALSAKEDRSWVKVQVSDTGIGITRKDIPHIFDRFYRGDRSRSTPGSGLGLSLALAIVRALGGSIEVTSEQGMGSTFTILLPHIPLSPLSS